MSSILKTDVFELYNSWGERIAFNEGFQAQKIADAKQAGRDAFSLGIDRVQGRELYFDAKDQRFSEAKEFLAGEPAAQIADDVETESIELDQIGDVTDGEETLGMESCVANETEWFQGADGAPWLADREFSAQQPSLEDEMAQDKYEETMSIIDDMSDDDWSRFHSMHIHN